MRTFLQSIGRDARWVMWSYALWGTGEGLWMFMQPLYVKSLGATPEQTGFVIGMWGLARLLFIMPFGILADRLGARRLMLPGWYLGFAGVLILAVAPDWRWAAPGFLVYGISAAAIPVTNLYLTQSMRHDPTRDPSLSLQGSLTLLWTAYSLGIVVSPGIGGLIGDTFGLRSVFFISLAWFGMSTLAIRRTTSYPTPVPPRHGYDYKGLLSRAPVLVAFGVLTLGFVAVLVGQPLSPQYLEEVRGFSPSSIGVFGSLNALGTALFSLMLGRQSAWRGFFISLLLVFGALGLLLSSGAWPVVVVGYFMLGAYYTTRPLATSVISRYVDEHRRGMGYALVDTLAGLATVIGTNVAGVLYAQDPEWPFVAGMVLITVVVALGVTVLRRPVHRNAAPDPAYTQVEVTGD